MIDGLLFQHFGTRCKQIQSKIALPSEVIMSRQRWGSYLESVACEATSYSTLKVVKPQEHCTFIESIKLNYKLLKKSSLIHWSYITSRNIYWTVILQWCRICTSDGTTFQTFLSFFFFNRKLICGIWLLCSLLSLL